MDKISVLGGGSWGTTLANLLAEKDLNVSVEKYQKLLTLNNIIEKKFKKSTKNIYEKTRENLLKIKSGKNAKKTT